MNWLKLLSAKRYGDKIGLPLFDTRSRFEQDFDRIIFSHPFRKLQDKTQVFPMPEDDFVHSRLTHSMEVASVGRSLGKEVGKKIIERNPDLLEAGLTYHDFGAITAAACLAHDIGNPPFGHSGETSISSFYSDTDEGAFFQDKVSSHEWSDLTQFEGNAQGYRILNNSVYGGLKLTYATLAAFTKYPISSVDKKDKKRKSQKKYGFTLSELGVFQDMAETTGLINLSVDAWTRHPLAFLVEAADDICYSIIDLEDGTRLGLVPFDLTRDLLAEVIGGKYSPQKLDALPDLNEKLGTLRAMTIGQLIQECVEKFLDVEDQLLDGTFDSALTDTIPSAATLNEITKLSVKRIYRSKQVLEREASGYNIIEKLMLAFTHAAYHMNKAKPNAKHHAHYRLIPSHIQSQLEKPDNTNYRLLQIVNDFVSGLTDGSAIRLFKIIGGQLVLK
ncbi:MAG: dNTP triphosphohydrolase [Cyclobacteriaceae bacterium]